jgi:hypothetical protein
MPHSCGLRPTQFPATRLGPLHDVAKVNCASCHQGSSKPLYGASMLTEFPVLGEQQGKETQGPQVPTPQEK